VSDIYKIAQLCRTFIWNGPLGVFEIPPFDNGSVTLANKIASLTTTRGLFSVAGGGETIAVIKRAGVMDKFSYVSTAGGAFLEWIEGKSLPGVEALKNNHVAAKIQTSKVVNGN
jgi:phosphoglycerate kinase